jgi:hypothetical protein
MTGIEGYAEAAEEAVQGMLLDQPSLCTSLRRTGGAGTGGEGGDLGGMSGHESLLEWIRNIRSCSKVAPRPFFRFFPFFPVFFCPALRTVQALPFASPAPQRPSVVS